MGASRGFVAGGAALIEGPRVGGEATGSFDFAQDDTDLLRTALAGSAFGAAAAGSSANYPAGGTSAGAGSVIRFLDHGF